MNEPSFQTDALLLEEAVRDLAALQDQEGLGQTNNSPEPRHRRRLTDQITASFYEACRIGNLDAAKHLVEALECEVKRSIRVAGVDRRHDGDDIAAVRARYECEVGKQEQEQARSGEALPAARMS